MQYLKVFLKLISICLMRMWRCHMLLQLLPFRQEHTVVILLICANDNYSLKYLLFLPEGLPVYSLVATPQVLITLIHLPEGLPESQSHLKYIIELMQYLKVFLKLISICLMRMWRCHMLLQLLPFRQEHTVVILLICANDNYSLKYLLFLPEGLPVYSLVATPQVLNTLIHLPEELPESYSSL